MTDRSAGSHNSEAERLFVEWLGNQPDLLHTRNSPAQLTPDRRATEADAASALAALCAKHPEHAATLCTLYSDYVRIANLLHRSGRTLHGPALAEWIRAQYGPGVDPRITLEPQGAETAASDFSSEVLSRLSSRPDASGRYRIQGELDRGGQGAILRVWDDDLRRHLAMKVTLGRVSKSGTPPTPPKAGSAPHTETPPVDARTVGRFLEEAQVTGQLDHPGIVPVHELGLDGQGRVFFTMKLVKGEDLKAVLARVHSEEPDWTITRVLSLLLKVCEAMSYAHAKGVIHRDLKPSNIMVGRYGEVFVMDWGLARVLDRKDDKDIRVRPPPAPLTSEVHSERRERAASDPDSPLITMDGDVVGTPAYMSPEQASGKLERMGPPSDVYALGAMLYHLLTRRMPYVAPDGPVNNYAILSRVQEGPPVSVASLAPDAPAELVAICEKAMAREPGSRYADMSALGEDLRAYLEHHVVAAYETGTWAETRKWVQRNTALAAATMVTVGVLAVALWAAVLLLGRARDAEQDARDRAAEADRERGTAVQATQTKELALAESEEALKRSEGFRLVTNSTLALGTDPSLALLLAIEGAKRAPGLQSNNALLAALRKQRERHTLRLENATMKKVMTRTDAAFSPDGARIATVGRADASVRIWDVATGRQLVAALIPGNDGFGASTVRYSPDGVHLVVASRRRALVYNASTLELTTSLVPSERATGFTDATDAYFDHNGTRIVACFGESVAYIWDIESKSELAVLRGHDAQHGYIDAISVASGLDRVATASFDHSARIWDFATGRELIRVEGHQLSVCSVALSPDGKRLLTGSDDGTSRLWDAETGSAVATLDAGGRSVRSVAFDASGRRALTGGWDGIARVWDVATGAPVAAAQAGSGITHVAFAPDGTRFVVSLSDCGICVCDTQTGLVVFRCTGHRESVTKSEFSPNGNLLASTSEDGTVRIWEASPNYQRLVPGKDGLRLISREPSTDGQCVVTTVDEGLDRVALATNAATGSVLATLVPGVQGESLDSALFSPDGNRVVTVGNNRTVAIWDIANRKQVMLVDAPEGVLDAEFSAAGDRLVTSSRYGNVRVFDLTSGFIVASVDLEGGWVWRVCFDSSGDHVVASCDDGTARIWEWKQRKKAPRKLTGHVARVVEASFDPVGRRVVTASDDGTARVWDMSDGRQVLVIAACVGPVHTVAFSPDGKEIATGGEDGLVLVWNADDGGLIRALSGHEGPVYSVRFLNDRIHVLTASDDGFARLWRLDTGATETTYPAPRGRVFDSWGELSELRLVSLLGPRTNATATIRRTGSGSVVATLAGHLKAVSVAAFSPDGQVIATTSDDRTVRVWRRSDGALLQSMDVPVSIASSLTFSHDGKRLIANGPGGFLVHGNKVPFGDGESRSELGHAVVWDVATGDRRLEIQDAIYATFSNDDRWIVTCHFREIDLRDSSTGEVLRQFEGGGSGVDISPDGRLVVATSGLGLPIVWDASTGLQIASLLCDGRSNWMKATFDATGRHILVRGQDPDIWRVFDCSTFQEILTIPDVPFRKSSGGFDQDADSISIYGPAGEVWRIPFDLAAAAETAKSRDLTPEETKQFDVGGNGRP